MRWLVPLIVSAAIGSPAWAEPAPAPPLIGRWALDVARLPMAPEARPKSVVIAFAETSDGKWQTTVDITAPDGAVRHMESRYRPGEATVPVEGDQSEADRVAIAMPAPNILVLALSRQGVPGSTRVYSTAADNRSMTETAITYGDDGTPRVRLNHFTRVQP